MALAVIEAKDNAHAVGAGMQQAADAATGPSSRWRASRSVVTSRRPSAARDCRQCWCSVSAAAGASTGSAPNSASSVSAMRRAARGSPSSRACARSLRSATSRLSSKMSVELPVHGSGRRRLSMCHPRGCDAVFAPSSRDCLHRLALEGEPGLALFWVVGRRILEATEGLALLQGLRQGPAQVQVVALVGEVLQDAEGVRRLDRLDEQPALVVARILGGFVQRIRFGPGTAARRIRGSASGCYVRAGRASSGPSRVRPGR
jgi:hypothetical protein